MPTVDVVTKFFFHGGDELNFIRRVHGLIKSHYVGIGGGGIGMNGVECEGKWVWVEGRDWLKKFISSCCGNG